MADITPYHFPDADEDSQERFIEQQFAESLGAKSVTQGDRTVVYQDPDKLEGILERRREKRRRGLFMLGTRHARRT